ncbi:MAG: 16S rRNA (uracil(1498)-N(3))-methyltransferase [Bacteroidales bacterium]|nr:16S rRNA (uracil(1498)-N(3))-methyltransferase [Bacteroidales bacterium]MBS3774066.1 16S rRNA (uracil(1498)-N(3))-methyltransferase [Bacteroidales bacterium]
MHLFYSPDLTDNRYELSQEDSRHCIRVLRLKKNDLIHLTDGKGSLYKARIIKDDPKGCMVEVVEKTSEYGKRPYYIHIAIAPTKNIKRFEWFLEKCTEIGIDEITPLICFHSERKHLKTERSKRIITSALKQSLKTYHPVLNEITNYNEFVNKPFEGTKFIAHCESGQTQHLKHLYSAGEDVTLIIGPEGDFSEKELRKAETFNFIPVSLGQSRLRTETAGIVACSIVNLLNE